MSRLRRPWGRGCMFFARQKATHTRAAAARFTPSFEQLETRDVPATASLMAGVLTINGTAGIDNIVLRQANNRVSVVGLTKTFATASIDSIVVNTRAGNDTVALPALNAQPWTKPVTVTSTGGYDKVRLLDGRTAYLGGGNQTLVNDPAGATTINGRNIDVFD